MAQQTDSIDALLQAQANQAQPAPTSSVAAAPDPIAAALSARAVGKDPSAAFSGIMPSQGKAAADRAVTLADNATTMPVLGAFGVGGEMAKNYLDSHLAPGSLLRRGADAVLGNAVDANAAFTHAVQNVPLSVAQLAMHGAAAAGDALSAPQQNIAGLVSGAAPQRAGVAGALDRARNALDTAIANREHTYQSGIPNSVGGITGAIAGNVLPMIAGGGVSLGAKVGEAADAVTGFAKGVPLLQKTLSGALQGAAYGGARPITNITPTDSYGSQLAGNVALGSVLGGAIPAVGNGLGKAYNVVKPIVNPNGVATDFLQNILGNRAPQVAQYLRNAPTYVPGSMPTSAQAAGVPQLVQAEKALANQFPDFKTALMDRATANNIARTGAVQNIAGDATTMQALQDARRVAIDPYVQQSLTPGEHLAANRWAGAQDAFQNVLDNPARMPSADFNAVSNAQKIVNQVRSGAMQEDDGLQALGELGDSVSTQKAQTAFQQAGSAINRNMVDPSGVLRTLATIRNGPLGVNADRAANLDALTQSIRNATNINGLTHTTMLDAVRQEASKILGNASDQSALAYAPARNSLVQAIDRVAPGYSDYLANYASHSAPITDAKAATNLLDRAPPVMVDGQLVPQFTLSGYRAGLKQAMNGDYPLSPGTQQILQNVQNDLSREAASNSVRMGGSDTAYNLASKSWLNSKLAGKLPFGVGSFLNAVGNAGNDRVGQAVSRLMLDPQAMASELEKLRTSNPRLLRALMPGVFPVAAGAVTQPPPLPSQHP